MVPRAWVRKAVAIVLLPLVAGVLSAGCVTTDVSRKTDPAAAGPKARIQVAFFATVKAQKGRSPVGGEVAWRLWRIDGEATSLLLESKEGRLTHEGASPGRYRVEVLRWVDADGKAHVPGSPHRESFRVGAGEVVTVDFVLSDRRGLGWALGGLAIAAIAVVIANEAWKDSWDDVTLDSMSRR